MGFIGMNLGIFSKNRKPDLNTLSSVKIQLPKMKFIDAEILIQERYGPVGSEKRERFRLEAYFNYLKDIEYLEVQHPEVE